MENASKALLIAGGILIAILILSMAVYLFTTYRSVGTRYDTTIESNEKIKFNTNFTKFIGRDNITAQEIVSVVNFVNNYEENNQMHIDVYVSINNINNTDSIKFIQDNTNTMFKCLKEDNITYDSNGLVKSIKFNE